jgi:hypothetical protein
MTGAAFLKIAKTLRSVSRSNEFPVTDELGLAIWRFPRSTCCSARGRKRLVRTPAGYDMLEQIPAYVHRLSRRFPVRPGLDRASAVHSPRSSPSQVALSQAKRIAGSIGAETSITSNVGLPLQIIRATRPYVTTLTGLCRSSESPVPTVTFRIAFTSI